MQLFGSAPPHTSVWDECPLCFPASFLLTGLAGRKWQPKWWGSQHSHGRPGKRPGSWSQTPGSEPTEGRALSLSLCLSINNEKKRLLINQILSIPLTISNIHLQCIYLLLDFNHHYSLDTHPVGYKMMPVSHDSVEVSLFHNEYQCYMQLQLTVS